MATYNATHTGGGTVGHPSGVAKAYGMTSPVYDAVDNTDLEQGDVVQVMDLPADTMIIGGCVETLEASGNGQITFDLGFTGGDVDCLVDVPADTMIIGGCVETLEASGNGQITFDLGFTGGDVDCLVDGGASTAVITPFLNAAAGATAANASMVTSADTIDLLVIDGGSSKTTAWRFRVHVVLVDISKNPVESATVTTGT